MRFRDRREAGRMLAALLGRYANRPDVLVLALPRGGVPVGYEVAQALGAPLDIFVVRKLGVPGHEELAMGALAAGCTEDDQHGLADLRLLSRVMELPVVDTHVDRKRPTSTQETFAHIYASRLRIWVRRPGPVEPRAGCPKP